ncbi:MAG: 2TM domain-containing protein [Chloroflexi bacterium]|nr:2TM domain-containing protein [Chloroflexota bacterium]
MWHGAVFLIVNAFLWFLDLREGGLEWAFWLTIMWGVALAFHVAWYFIGERESRKYRSSLDEERQIVSTS